MNQPLKAEAIELALLRALPADLAHVAPWLARSLALLAQGEEHPSTSRSGEPGEDAIRGTLLALQGQTVPIPGGLLTFGAQSQIGDVSLHDVAGNNIVKVTINVFSQFPSSQPSSLEHSSAHSTPANNTALVCIVHASNDEQAASELYRWLWAEGLNPWLAVKDLLPGQRREETLRQVIGQSEAVLILLSTASLQSPGSIHKQIKWAREAADERPHGTIYLIPLRIDPCPLPEGLVELTSVDLFVSDGHTRLARALSNLRRK